MSDVQHLKLWRVNALMKDVLDDAPDVGRRNKRREGDPWEVGVLLPYGDNFLDRVDDVCAAMKAAWSSNEHEVVIKAFQEEHVTRNTSPGGAVTLITPGGAR